MLISAMDARETIATAVKDHCRRGEVR